MTTPGMDRSWLGPSLPLLVASWFHADVEAAPRLDGPHFIRVAIARNLLHIPNPGRRMKRGPTKAAVQLPGPDKDSGNPQDL